MTKRVLSVVTNAGHYAMYESPVALMTSIEKVLGGAIHPS